jgi:general secretion pathway protein I
MTKAFHNIFFPGEKQANGFTLLEVMVAVAILAVSLVVLFGSQSRSLSYATEAHFNTLVPMLAASKFAELESLGEIGESDGDFGEEFPGYSWQLEVEDASLEGFAVLEELAPPLQRAEFSVSWNETNLRYSLVYYGRWQD